MEKDELALQADMDKGLELSEEIRGDGSKLMQEMFALAQPRSNHALEHFVVLQHDMPGRQREQILAELESLSLAVAGFYDDYENAQLDLEECDEKWQHDSEMRFGSGVTDVQRERATARAEIEKRTLRRRMVNLHLAMTGRMREIHFLMKLLEKIPAYDREKFEQEEGTYWSKRLPRQHLLGQMGDAGNIEAVLQMLAEVGKPRPELPLTMPMLAAQTGVNHPIVQGFLKQLQDAQQKNGADAHEEKKDGKSRN